MEGVLNPASGRGPDGEVYLLPRLVAAGNVSRIGLARVVVEDGVPVGVERQGVVLEPDRSWERGIGNAGVEDPRITWMADLGLHVMTYVAYGPLGPRTALAVSSDLREWRRLGPVLFTYDDELDIDLNLFHNKDAVFFPEPVHRARRGAQLRGAASPDVGSVARRRPTRGSCLPAGIDDPRQSIWISYVPVEAVDERSVGARAVEPASVPRRPGVSRSRSPRSAAGPPRCACPKGWLLLHHGVTGHIERAFDHQQNVHYAAGAMLLDGDDPSIVIARTPEPLLQAETEDERGGIVPNVVFPTAIEEIDGVRYVFYGMADSKIGVARLDHA